MRARCILVLLALVTANLACGGSVMDERREPANGNAAATNTATNAPPPPRRLTWGSGWSVDLRPVYSGTPIQAGRGVLRVEEWAAGPARLSYEFPAFTDALVPKQFRDQSDGLVRREPVAGTILVPIDVRNRAIYSPPMFWPGGEKTAPGPILWLPVPTLAALREQHAADVEIAPLPGGMTMTTKASTAGATRKLRVVGEGEVAVEVDGQPTRFPALKVEDDLKSSYTVLNALENPLVVRFRLGHPAVAGGRELLTGETSGYDVVGLHSPRPAP